MFLSDHLDHLIYSGTISSCLRFIVYVVKLWCVASIYITAINVFLCAHIICINSKMLMMLSYLIATFVVNQHVYTVL